MPLTMINDLTVLFFSNLKVREICQVIGSGIQPLQNLSVLQKIGDEKKMEWGHFYINKGFIGEWTINITLEYHSGRFIICLM